jgi:hypothetical protein
MTVIHGIEIDDIEYKPNDIKRALRTRVPLEDKLHVIAVVSNPCMFARRYILMKEFMERIERDEPDVVLYVVELLYPGQRPIVTTRKNPRHLQLRADHALWHKENMINLGVKKLLPADWKAMAWIDADLEFDSPTWATDTLRVLNGECDIVQLFSHCVDMDPTGRAMHIFQSAGFQYSKQVALGSGKDLWHPGYAWACTRGAFEVMGGLYDRAILGSGDNIMMMALIGHVDRAINRESTGAYQASVVAFQDRGAALRFGYVPGVIRHFYHGSKKNRRYADRWQILVRWGYDPDTMVKYDEETGVLVPVPGVFPEGLLEDILGYFGERNEDEGVGADGKYGVGVETGAAETGTETGADTGADTGEVVVLDEVSYTR